ncbi:hypothetical protein HOP50_04g30310 [Chloropicon primus]|uniref:Uncharacterized protein n=1 Tax=Chloropicon primus TaxID=1764295 RepID=A0A5B8MJ71_9CHLO|nr:hypothetical protein A3770_04p30310 [Chloropicon primus]UPQ99723.1 hypothetical protein HOP50_04g30310 [Chloropicon primus]|eukprot:QDZ20513.1 hypothetical protein A3770_04p30310 [Chloropicon primus]
MWKRRKVFPLGLVFAGFLGIACIVGLDTYPKMSQAVNYSPPKQQLCTVSNRDPSRGCVEVSLMYNPYGEACVFKGGDPTTKLEGIEMTKYLNKYDVGAQHTCYHPKDDVSRITFAHPPRPEGLLLSFTILLPFVLLVLLGTVMLGHKPRPKIETMVKRTEKLIARHDKKTKNLNEDNLKEIATLKGKIEREQEKRLQFVTELTQERAERLRQYDDLKDDLIRDFSRVEEKLGLEDGVIRKSSGLLPIPSQYKGKGSREERKGKGGKKTKSDFGGLLDTAKQSKRRQSTALDAERQRQDDIFKKKLAERRKNRL